MLILIKKILYVLFVLVVTVGTCFATDRSDTVKTSDTGGIKEVFWKLRNIGKSRVDEKEISVLTDRVFLRLKQEHWKLQVLFNEIVKLDNGLDDLRDLLMYPSFLTKTKPQWVSRFDRKIKESSKNIKEVKVQADELYRPLLDAIAILKEMTSDEIDMDMLSILELENKERVKTILSIKREINEQWKKINTFFEELAELSGMEFKESEESLNGFDAEFFEILYSNLGKSSDLFFEKLSAYKDTLVARGNKKAWKEMAALDMFRIRKRINDGYYETTSRELKCLINRYLGKIEIGGLHYLYGKTLLSLGRYREAEESYGYLKPSSSYFARAQLGRMRAFYLLGKFSKVVDIFGDWVNGGLTSKQYNLAVLVASNSAYRLGRYSDVVEFVTMAKPQSKYYTEILYTLFQVYVKKKDYVTASKVLEKAIKLPKSRSGNKSIRTKLVLSRGYLSYEEKKYDKSIEDFMTVIKDPKYFADGLLGLVWSYLKSGRMDEAEMALRKLINQNPNNHLAVEGILLLSKKMVAQADMEWKYQRFCYEEKEWIDKLEISLENKIQAKSIDENEIKKAKIRIDSLKSMSSKRMSLDIEKIARMYNMANKMCDIIINNYSSGFFLETTFKGYNEKIVDELSKLHATIEARKKNMFPDEIRSANLEKRNSMLAVKNAVSKSRVFKIKLLIKYRNWKNEYAKSHLSELSRKIIDATEDAKIALDSNIVIKTELLVKNLKKDRENYFKLSDSESRVLRKKIIDEINSCINNQSLSGEQEEYLKYMLAELLYEEQKNKYVNELAKYDRKMMVFDSLDALFATKKIKEEPSMPTLPVLDYTEVINICKETISSYPNGYYADAISYLLGFCYSDNGIADSARANFEHICNKFPKSRYAPQSFLIVGEYCFDNAELEKAAENYSKVLDYAGSEWFDEAIYKLGWTYYRLSKAKKAISTFMYLMRDNEMSLGGSSQKTKSLLEKESIDYIAISFTEDGSNKKGDELSKAKKFVNKINDESKGAKIMWKLAKVYLAHGTSKSIGLAREAYQTILDMFPDYADNSKIEMELMQTYEKQGKLAKANKIRIGIFKKYNRNGSWVQNQKDETVKAFADSIAKVALFDAANSYILEAAQSSSVSLYRKALRAYKKYVETYDKKDPKTQECHYNVAEIMFSLGQYQNAAQEYVKVSRLYGQGKQKEVAAWNAIVSAQNYQKKTREFKEEINAK